MTTLVVSELKTTLSQDVTIKNRILLRSVRPRLLKYLSPTGTMTVKVKSGAQVVATKSLTSAQMESSDDDITNSNYFHGYINFDFTDAVALNRGSYTIEMSYDDTFSESAYFGWIHDYESRTYDLDYSITAPQTITKQPLGLQLWSYKKDFEA